MIDIRTGDVIEQLKLIDDKSVDTVVTSPPYWGLRDYGIDGQIGLEDDLYFFINKLVLVFKEVKRVLKDHGTLWINMGDTYAMSNVRGGNKDFTGFVGSHNHWDKSMRLGKRNIPNGLKPKDLCGTPFRLAFALQEDGWYLRQDIIWHKPNPMPESVKDRCTKAHEYIFLLSKNKKYYYDNEAIKEDSKYPQGATSPQSIGKKSLGRKGFDIVKGLKNMKGYHKRNKRSVWTVTTKPTKEAHFATYPKDLIEPCILAGSPVGGMVLDPFAGSGTTGIVAENNGRNSIMIELNPEYIEIMKKRIDKETNT